MTRSILTTLLIAGTVMAGPDQSDPFERLKAAMARAACCRFEFLSIVESEVFKSCDTTRGVALIAADGRYHITIGPDEYLKTADKLYSYSTGENQLTVETVDPGAITDETVSFITRLDEFYSTQVRARGREYFLRRTDSTAGSLPDSLLVYVSKRKPELDRLEYLDINNDKNRIVFLKREYLDKCDEQALTPRFPDSTQVIHLQ